MNSSQPVIEAAHAFNPADRIKDSTEIFSTHLWAMIMKRVWYFKRDYKSLACEIFLPILVVALGLLLMSISFAPDRNDLILAPSIWGTLPLKFDYNTVMDTQQTTPAQLMSFFSPNNFSPSPLTTTSLTNFDSQVFAQYGTQPYMGGSYYVSQANPITQQYAYYAFVNTTWVQAAPFWYNMMNNAILQYATNKSTSQIRAVISPYKLTAQQRARIAARSTGTQAVLIFGMAYAFIPASLIAFIVRERELNIKHQQIVSGVAISSYWTANYIVDLVKHILPAVVCALLVLAFSVTDLTSGDGFGMVWALFFFFGTAAAPFSYLTSFLYDAYGTAQTTTFLVGFLGGLVGAVVVLILTFIDSTKNAAPVIAFFFRLLPNFCFSNGLLNIANRQFLSFQAGSTTTLSSFSSTISLWDLIFLIAESIIYFIAVFIVERYRVGAAAVSIVTHERNVPTREQKLDDDVMKEAQEVAKADPAEYSVLVRDLRKLYSLGINRFKIAVEKASFSLKTGECFALLGVNGAGKTTTFKVLSGEILQTSGKAYIAGYDTETQMTDIRPLIGYCPQFDALLDNLTSREHLLMYCAIKGIPTQYREAVVQEKLKEMNLLQYADILAGTYSGGNKRKLSVAIALIGNPQIVLLDEPSSGMDPGARRFMWDVISNITTQRKETSIILTTHSMDEAEALSTKLCIMVDGTFMCMGSIQHIKSKFGKGYELEIRIKPPTETEMKALLAQLGMQYGTQLDNNATIDLFRRANCEHLAQGIRPDGPASAIWTELTQTGAVESQEIAEFILIDRGAARITNFLQQAFGGFTLVEQLGSFFRFRIDTQIGLGKTFGVIEENKQNLNVLQYSLKQTSLEQIFNMFAGEKE